MSGAVVIGMVTGTHMIEDIRVAVAYQVFTPISADKVYRSRDIWIAINQKRIKLFWLTDASRNHARGPAMKPSSATSSGEGLQLRQEVEQLKAEVDRLQLENKQLRQQLAGQPQDARLQEKLEAILLAVGRLEGGQATVEAGLKAAVEAVGGETPTFVPTTIKPKDAKASIDIETKTADTSVSSAASKLRQLKKGRSFDAPEKS